MKSSTTAWAPPMMISLAAAVVSGCAAAPVPADKLARAQSVVDTAEQAHAEAEPNSASHLQLAKEQLKSAKSLMRDGDNRSAEWVLRRAEADAESALALAQAHRAKTDAARTLEAIKQAMSMMQSGGHGS